jgi:hypothetical protein
MNTTAETFVGSVPFSRFSSIVATSRENNHQHWIGDIPVHKELLTFFKAFKDKRYNVIPCVDFSPASMTGTTGMYYQVYREIGIMYPDVDKFRSGSISIEHNSKNVVEFCVESKDINNEKYSSGSGGYNTRKSKDVAKALKVALKFLIAPDYEAIEARCNGMLHTSIENLRDPARSKLYNKLSINRSDLAHEMQNMIALGYVPATTSFKAAVDLLATEGAELRRMENYKPRACFVWVRDSSLSYKFTDDHADPTVCTSMDQVPELIRNKLAVLQIAQVGEAIADVGVRVSDKTYWVFA